MLVEYGPLKHVKREVHKIYKHYTHRSYKSESPYRVHLLVRILSSELVKERPRKCTENAHMRYVLSLSLSMINTMRISTVRIGLDLDLE